MEKTYKTRGRIVMALSLLQLLAALALMILGIMNDSITDMQSNIIMGVALFLYWLLMDIVEPKVTHRFDDITPAQKAAYPKYILWDFAGYAGIAYFLLGMGTSQNNSLIGAIIYAVSMKPKRENQDIFLGRVVPEEEEDSDESEEVVETEETPAIEEKEIEE